MQISISAFATLEDIAAWLAPFAEKIPLHFALEVYFPENKVIPLAHWNQFVEISRRLSANELWIDLAPIPSARGDIDSSRRRSHRFFVNLPEWTKKGLREGDFWTLATKESHLKIWRSLIRVVRKNTTGGVWVQNAVTKRSGCWNRSRYSADVAERHANGLRLFPFAGGNEMFINKPA